MPQDPFERVKVILSETSSSPWGVLFDFAILLPESLFQKASQLAWNNNNHALIDFLIRASVRRQYGADKTKEDASSRAREEAKRLIAKLSEEQLHETVEVFEQLFVWAKSKLPEPTIGSATRIIREDDSPPSPPTHDEPGGVASVDPPDNTGGGGFEAVDDGFESVGGEELEEANGGGGGSADTTERRDIVNLGFSHNNAADKTLKPDEPLQTEHSYFFWLNIGRKHKDAIGAPTRIDLEKLPEEAVLTVAIFGFKNELEITSGHDIGELKIQKDGSVKVLRQPGDDDSIPLSNDAPKDYLDDFLIFPVSVPNTEATHRLRCNIYCAQVLVQSYVVSAHVKSTPGPVTEACTKKLDYVLSESLRASHLALMTKEPHLLSLMVNDNGDGTHGFRFFGDDGSERFKDDAQIDGQQLSGFLREARAAMRKISWGDDEEWGSNAQQSYRYQKQKFDEAALAKDLAYLARAGTRIYAGFQSHLKLKPSQLEALLANSGLIQIALKLSPRAVLPAAVVYDYAWRPDVFEFPTTDFKLCPSFSTALKEAIDGGPPLEDCVCFHGGCKLKQMIAEIKKPGSGKMLSGLGPIICPSGFWGYRHLLGLPLTLDGANTDIPPVIEFKDSLQMIACVSTDQEFVERDPHLDRLKALQNLKFARDDGYDPFLLRLRSVSPHLIYFYCHGGVRAGSFNPFLQVGASDEIDPSNWLSEGIEWTGPNPLVFINGCHTTSLNPEVTLDFVSSFVQTSGAAGVIGTEITIFEPLAVKFAEECFKRFIGAPPHTEKMPIGKAVRGARLELLKQGNPLGLVYIPYAVATLRLEESKQN